jgi:hypothetical protein
MRDAASTCGDAVMPMPLQTTRSNIHHGTSMRSPAASRLQRKTSPEPRRITSWMRMTRPNQGCHG